MNYTTPQKAVAVLIALGQPEASAVLARMSRQETEILLANSRKMRSVPPEVMAAIAAEFEREFNRAETIYDPDSKLHQLVADARKPDLGESEPSVLIPVNQAPPSYVFTAFENVPNEEIVEFLSAEDDLVAACVLSRLPGEGVGDILGMMDESRRASLFKAMATLGEPKTAALQAIDAAAGEFFQSKKEADNTEKLKSLARILNSIDRESADGAIRSLQDTFEEKDMSSLRSMLFRFEDITKLEGATRSAVFDAIPADTITMALRDADENLREAILASISQRTRRIIENDLKSPSKANQAAVRNAQKMIVSQILNLSATGSFTLPGNDLEAA